MLLKLSKNAATPMSDPPKTVFDTHPSAFLKSPSNIGYKNQTYLEMPWKQISHVPLNVDGLEWKHMRLVKTKDILVQQVLPLRERDGKQLLPFSMLQ